MRALVEDKGDGSIPGGFQHLVPQALLIETVVPLGQVTRTVGVFSRRPNLDAIHTSPTAEPNQHKRGRKNPWLSYITVTLYIHQEFGTFLPQDNGFLSSARDEGSILSDPNTSCIHPEQQVRPSHDQRANQSGFFNCSCTAQSSLYCVTMLFYLS